MRDHQHRDAAVHIQPREDLDDVPRRHGVEIARRFIGKQRARLRHDGPRDRHPLLLPA